MAGSPLRLLHAASVQLDVPLSGIGELPRDVVDTVATATLVAWERLIEAAITQDVDALVLTADTFDAEAGSLAADVALRTGFERLAEREILVFVTPGTLDTHAGWQDLPTLPDNVAVFDSPWDSAVELTDRGKLRAVLMPVSVETDVAPPELAAIQSRKATPDGRPIQVGLLWAAGPATGTAVPQRTAAFASLDVLLCPHTADLSRLPLTEGHIHRQASPQGMTAQQRGVCGATLLEFDAQRKWTSRLLPLAPVRRERLSTRIDPARHKDDLLDRMLSQLEELPPIPGEQLRVIEWAFSGSNEAIQRWKWSDELAADVASALTELTDQPGKLRCVHQAVPTWQLPSDEAQRGELWRDYLQLLEQRGSLSLDDLRKSAEELRPQQATSQGAWERWTQQLDPAAVMRRAHGSGRRWFEGV